MIRAVYVTDNSKQVVEFMYSLASDLRKFGIKDIENDREHNLIIVAYMEIKGLSIYKSNICHGMRNIKYFIDGIDMRIYKDASERQIESLNSHVKDVMTHFRKDTKQLGGKDELIKILTENTK